MNTGKFLCSASTPLMPQKCFKFFNFFLSPPDLDSVAHQLYRHILISMYLRIFHGYNPFASETNFCSRLGIRVTLHITLPDKVGTTVSPPNTAVVKTNSHCGIDIRTPSCQIQNLYLHGLSKADPHLFHRHFQAFSFPLRRMLFPVSMPAGIKIFKDFFFSICLR